jgi:hypothetical protein
MLSYEQQRVDKRNKPKTVFEVSVKATMVDNETID